MSHLVIALHPPPLRLRITAVVMETRPLPMRRRPPWTWACPKRWCGSCGWRTGRPRGTHRRSPADSGRVRQCGGLLPFGRRDRNSRMSRAGTSGHAGCTGRRLQAAYMEQTHHVIVMVIVDVFRRDTCIGLATPIQCRVVENEIAKS